MFNLSWEIVVLSRSGTGSPSIEPKAGPLFELPCNCHKCVQLLLIQKISVEVFIIFTVFF